MKCYLDLIWFLSDSGRAEGVWEGGGFETEVFESGRRKEFVKNRG